MNFDKPKVTIDLEEYNYLKQLEQEKQIDPGKWAIAAKKILWYSMIAAHSRHLTPDDLKKTLHKEGIMYYTNPSSSAFNTWESLGIKLEDPKP